MGSESPYSFAGNDPINGSDLAGLAPCPQKPQDNGPEPPPEPPKPKDPLDDMIAAPPKCDGPPPPPPPPRDLPIFPGLGGYAGGYLGLTGGGADYPGQGGDQAMAILNARLYALRGERAQVPRGSKPPALPTPAPETPSCLRLFIRSTLENISGPMPGLTSFAGPAANYLALSRVKSALAYAASRPNVYGTQGLIKPFASGAFRSLYKSGFKIAARMPVAFVVAAELQALYTEYQAARAGECQ